MKREQSGDDSVGSVKRLATTTTLLPSQIYPQPQQLVPVPLLPSPGTGTLNGAPTAVALAVQTEHAPVGGEHCLLGGTITYSQPSLHPSSCNIVLATPQPYVTPVTVTHPVNISSTFNNTSENHNSISYSHHGSTVVATYSHIVSEDELQSYPSAVAVDSTALYAGASSQKDNTSLVNNISLSQETGNKTFIPKEPVDSKKSVSVATKKTHNSRISNIIRSKRYQESRNNSAARRSQESVEERQERLSLKFDALIRAKIIELVRTRGAKKTVCPSEVARALSPKAWRDLMPKVRNIGAELVKEGLILVTQRGIIVDLATVRGPVRFGLAS